MCWALALLAFGAERLLASRPSPGTLLIGPVNREGFQFLALLAAVVLVAAALWMTATAATRPPAPGWTRAIATVLHLAIAGALVVCAWPLLWLGVLSFSNEYRTIGTVDGHELIVGTGVGLGQFPIQAGLRHGLFVNFGDTTGDDWTTGDVPLKNMTFTVADGADAVTIIYAPGPAKRTGTMVIPKQ